MTNKPSSYLSLPLLLVSIFILISGYFFSQFLISQQYQKLHESDEATLRELNSQFYQTLQNPSYLLHSLSELEPNTSQLLSSIPALKSQQEKIIETFRNLLWRERLLEEISIVELNGKEQIKLKKNVNGYIKNFPDDQLGNQINNDFFRNALSQINQNIYVSNIFPDIKESIDKAPATPAIYFIKPLKTRQGSIHALLSLKYNLASFFDLARELTNNRLQIIDSLGFYLMHPDNQKEFGQKKPSIDNNLGQESPVIWQHLKQTKNGSSHLQNSLQTFYTLTLNDDKVPLSRLEISMMLQRPETQLQNIARPIQITVAVICLAITILLAIILQKLRQAQIEQQATLQLSTFIEQSPVALAMFDKDMRYITTSKTWITTLNLEGREIIGKTHYEVFPRTPKTWIEAHQRGLQGEVLKNQADDSYLTRNGKTRWINWEVSPWRDTEGEIGGIILFSQDVTDSINEKMVISDLNDRMTQQMVLLEKSKNEAELANVAKSLFVANISHELRTPLHAIKNFANLISKKVEQPKLQTFADNIVISANRLTRVINDLLDLSKLQSGRSEIILNAIDLNDVIQGSINEIKPLLDRQMITVQFSAKQPLIVDADENKIFQVMINILSNAIRYSPDGSKITITTRLIEAHQEPNLTNSITVSVQDQGVGIPKAELTEVFESFVQSSQTTTGAGGTGLGLALCKELIEAHNGVIWADSNNDQVSRGTRITFALPQSTATS